MFLVFADRIEFIFLDVLRFGGRLVGVICFRKSGFGSCVLVMDRVRYFFLGFVYKFL